MVVAGRGINRSSIPLIIPGAVRVESMRVLGVQLRQDLRMSSHINAVLASCSSSMYALNVLRSHGLSSVALQEVEKATTVAHLMYASPAWWGYTQAKELAKVEQLLGRMKRRGLLCPQAKSAATMAIEADKRLFDAICSNQSHVLHRLFPPPRPPTGYELRSRSHSFTLPHKDDRNFISRALFNNIY